MVKLHGTVLGVTVLCKRIYERQFVSEVDDWCRLATKHWNVMYKTSDGRFLFTVLPAEIPPGVTLIKGEESGE